MLLVIFIWIFALAGAIRMSYFLFKISVPVAKVGLLGIGLSPMHKGRR
jgi:hypothetical protein